MNNTETRSSESRLRAPRFKVDEELVVSSRTIGTGIPYELKTADISRSGMLLSWRHDVNKIPFRENTLLELEIDPQKKLFRSPVNALGKVVRKFQEAGDTSPSVKLGIQIVQIDGEDLGEWEKCLDYLNRNASHLLTNSKDYLQKVSNS